MNGFASKDSVLQMLLETESDMSSAEKALTEAVRRTEQEKQSA
ncbi:YppD family protein, partial [Bacillus licheniformis]